MKVMYVSSLTKSEARYWKSDPGSNDPGNISLSFFFYSSNYLTKRNQKDLGQKMTPLKVRDVLIKS